jgi:hypothetical protein
LLSSYFPILAENRLEGEEDIGLFLSQVEPLFDCPMRSMDSFEHYLQSIQKIVRRIIPKELMQYAQEIESLDEIDKIRHFYKLFEDSVPTTSWTSDETQFPSTISIVTVCSANYTQGVGRFLGDMFSRWLVPGKQFPLVYMHSMAFQFKANPGSGFYLFEVFAKVDNKKDYTLIKANLPGLAQEIKLNILSVQHARRVISLKPLTIEQKKIIIQENISSLLDRPSKDFSHSLFEQMHQFFIKVAAEHKVMRIKEQISPLLEFKPQVFERDLFSELHNCVYLFKDAFTADRDLRHLTRIISYMYLFRKVLSNMATNNPHQRHLNFKLLHTQLQVEGKNRLVLGILVGINILRDNEIIGEKHIYRAIQSIIPTAELLPQSSISDKRKNSPIKMIYIEVFHESGRFSHEEISDLRARLPKEIKTRIESVINPIFMPRNEEEVMRNILVLSNQLKYVQDIPQVIITFHKQTESKIAFTVILLRIVRPTDLPLQKLFLKHKSKVKFSDHEIKTVGLLRKRHPKEANIFEMLLHKKAFLRKDFSVDLNEARKFIYHKLTEMLGEIRDYNGGMISKQNEVLTELKKILLQINVRNDFLLENFFYSISPNYMQSLLKPHILKKLFLLVLESLEHDYSSQIYFLKTQIVEDFFLLTVGAVNPSLKEFLEQRIEALEFEASSLSTSYVNIYDICCLSYLLRFNDCDQHQQFLQLIIESIRVWKDTMQTEMPSDFFPEFS